MVLGKIKWGTVYTTVYKCSKFIVHLPRPMFPTSIDFNLIDIQCLSTVGVSSEYEVTITLFGFAAFKASTHHPKFNISGIFILQSWSKISSRICPANNLSLQMSHGREKTQTVTARLLQMPSGERAFEQEDWAHSKGSPASCSGMEKGNISHADASLGCLPV